MNERQGFGFIQTAVGTIFTASVTNLTASIDVSDFNKVSIQPVYLVSGNSTASLTTQSSLDGVNWFTDFTFTATSNSSSLNYITNKRSYIRALNQMTGSVTGSLHFLAGN